MRNYFNDRHKSTKKEPTTQKRYMESTPALSKELCKLLPIRVRGACVNFNSPFEVRIYLSKRMRKRVWLRSIVSLSLTDREAGGFLLMRTSCGGVFISFYSVGGVQNADFIAYLLEFLCQMLQRGFVLIENQ